MIRLYTIWNSKHINFKLKYNLYRSLVLSILTYGCETWTISVAMQKKISAFESKAHRKLLGIKYQDKITNVCVRNRITIRPVRSIQFLILHIKYNTYLYFSIICINIFYKKIVTFGHEAFKV